MAKNMTKQTTINGIIYKTTNIINNKWYIGKDEKNDPLYLGSGKYLNRAIAKYGKENFKKEILDYSDNKEHLALLEKLYIEKYNAVYDIMSYNIAEGGFGGNTISGMTEEDKTKFSNKMKEIWVTMPEDKKKIKSKKISKALKNKSKSEDHKNKISISKKGVKQSSDTIEKKRTISKKLYEEGRIRPPITDWTGKTHSQETKNLISKIKTGKKNIKNRLFNISQQKEIKRLFQEGMSVKELSRQFNTSCPTIRRYIREDL